MDHLDLRQSGGAISLATGSEAIPVGSIPDCL